METTLNEILLIACESGKAFTDRIVQSFNNINPKEAVVRIAHTEEITFANGEVKVIIHESIRRKEVFIVQLLNDPLSSKSVNDNLMALLTAIDAAHQADASEINVILPQFPYSRQERRKGREGITAKICAQAIENAGALRIFSFDLHAEAVVGFFDRARLDNLRASNAIIEKIDTIYKKRDFIMVSPDAGGAERNNFFAKHFEVEFAMMYKTRNYKVANTIDNIKLVGDVKDKNVLMVDDIIDTAGTMVKACEALKSAGAADIVVACTFPYFTGQALEKICKAYKDKVITKLIGTDAVFRGEKFEKEHLWYDEITVAPVCAHVIFQIYRKKSINQLL